MDLNGSAKEWGLYRLRESRVLAFSGRKGTFHATYGPLVGILACHLAQLLCSFSIPVSKQRRPFYSHFIMLFSISKPFSDSTTVPPSLTQSVRMFPLFVSPPPPPRLLLTLLGKQMKERPRERPLDDEGGPTLTHPDFFLMLVYTTNYSDSWANFLHLL